LQQSGPHRGGWRKDEISKMFLDHSNKLVDAVLLDLVRRGTVKERRERFSTADHVPTLDAAQQKACDRLLGEIRKVEFAPPTLDAWGPLMPRFGITRLANITGLDDIGLPVYMAVRPLSKGLSVSQGKGTDDVSAAVSAMMESIESWHGERIERPVRRATLAE